jgi:hypothetical protein
MEFVKFFVSLSQVCSEKYKFDAESIKNMEIFVMGSLNWRMQAVTPFSYINYFMDKFTQGKPLSCGFASRCSELILGTLEGRLHICFMNKFEFWHLFNSMNEQYTIRTSVCV